MASQYKKGFTMRLSQKERREIKSILSQIFGEATIYIFGSRLDDTRRGGDIDIFVQLKKPTENLRAKRAKAQLLLEEKLLKPVDILIEGEVHGAIADEAKRGVAI